MRLNNEKAKIYRFGVGFLGIVIIVLGILYLIHKSALIMHLQQIFLVLFMLLLGTREAMARKNMIGFLCYLAAGFIFIVFIMGIF